MVKAVVRDLVKKFKWTIVCGDSSALDRPLVLADTNRPGLELAGYFPDSQTKRLVVLGDKEIGYIEGQMDEESQRRSFEFLTGDNTPCIVICRGHECPKILKEIAIKKNFPVFKSEHQTSHVIVSITNYLDECLAESIILHGELVRVHGVGVLITGKSGMGKSEIALELIKRGHQLVGDDRIDCYKIHDELVGRTAPMLEGFMELRGVGIINVSRMYGVGAIAHEAQIELQIDLEPFDASYEYDRVGIEEKEYSELFGIKILKMTIPVSQGRPMSTVIETAVTNYLLLKEGLDSAKEFEERVLTQISENKGETE
jgi:HPr kinase/phosphorylase